MDQTKLARSLRVVDYAVGAATLGYGALTSQPLFIGFGLGGLVLAHMNLSERISSRLRQYFSRKRPEVAPPAPALEVHGGHLGQSEGIQSAYYGVNRLNVGQELYGKSPHSVFNSNHHLNHSR